MNQGYDNLVPKLKIAIVNLQTTKTELKLWGKNSKDSIPFSALRLKNITTYN